MKDYETDSIPYSYSIQVSHVVSYEEMIEDPRSAVDVAAGLCGVAVGEARIPVLGDDRGCAEPYRQLVQAALTMR